MSDLRTWRSNVVNRVYIYSHACHLLALGAQLALHIFNNAADGDDALLIFLLKHLLS